jgi:hypothetical protein
MLSNLELTRKLSTRQVCGHASPNLNGCTKAGPESLGRQAGLYRECPASSVILEIITKANSAIERANRPLPRRQK